MGEFERSESSELSDPFLQHLSKIVSVHHRDQGFAVSLEEIRWNGLGRNQCRVEVTADHASVIFTFLGLPGDPITSRFDASLPISTTSEPG